jgi:hypothetical protein
MGQHDDRRRVRAAAWLRDGDRYSVYSVAKHSRHVVYLLQDNCGGSMDLSPALRAYVGRELTFVAQKLRTVEANSAVDAAYYYSAVYGCLNRVLNIEYSDELCLAHLVTLGTHQALAQRIAAATTGQEPSIAVPVGVFQWLADTTDALAKEIENDALDVRTLGEISRVGYAVTGNGFYLAGTGAIPVKWATTPS